MSSIKTKSLEEFYFQGGKSYQYGGEVPVILFPDPSPSPTPTPNPSQTPTITPTPSITPSITPTNTQTPTLTKTPTNTPTNTMTNTPTPSLTPGYIDPNAQAFFDYQTSLGETLTSTEEDAVNQLVIDLKYYNLWDYFFYGTDQTQGAVGESGGLYPFVGGTSGSTSVNLAYPYSNNLIPTKIDWKGGMSFSSLGVLGNSSNSAGVSNKQGNSSSNGFFVGVYINQGLVNTPSDEYDMSCYTTSFVSPRPESLISLGLNDKTTKYVNYNSNNLLTTTGGTYTNCMLLGQSNGTTTELYQNNTLLLSSAQTYNTIVGTWTIGGRWTGSVVQKSSGRGYGFAFLARKDQPGALTPTEIQNLYTSIYNFCNTLGRA